MARCKCCSNNASDELMKDTSDLNKIIHVAMAASQKCVVNTLFMFGFQEFHGFQELSSHFKRISSNSKLFQADDAMALTLPSLSPCRSGCRCEYIVGCMMPPTLRLTMVVNNNHSGTATEVQLTTKAALY